MTTLLSFLGFLAREAPEIVGVVRGIVEKWSHANAVDPAELLPALGDDVAPRVAGVDAAVDAMIDREFPKKDQ